MISYIQFDLIFLENSTFSKEHSNIVKYRFFFVCVGFIVPLENFSLTWRRYHYRWKAANSYLCSSLKVIEQLGFFNVPYLHWHGASVYNGHLQESVTLTPIAERLAVNYHYLFLQLRSVAAGIRTPNLPLAGPTLSPTAPPSRCLM